MEEYENQRNEKHNKSNKNERLDMLNTQSESLYTHQHQWLEIDQVEMEKRAEKIWTENHKYGKEQRYNRCIIDISKIENRKNKKQY